MNAATSSQQRFSASPDAVGREVGGESILLNLESGTYYGLNAVGGRVWKMLDSGAPTLAEICDTIEAEFDAPRPDIERDVQKLMTDLADQGLVETRR